jgi:hypothetical protein
MLNFTRALILGGTAMVLGSVYYLSAAGAGMQGIHNRKIIKIASQDCPSGRVDEFGNCLERNYRSAYYRSYYFDNSSYGRGK